MPHSASSLDRRCGGVLYVYVFAPDYATDQRGTEATPVGLPAVKCQFLVLLGLRLDPMADSTGPSLPDVHLPNLFYINVDIMGYLPTPATVDVSFGFVGPSLQLLCSRLLFFILCFEDDTGIPGPGFQILLFYSAGVDNGCQIAYYSRRPRN
jgi:hypothetical protein